MTRLSMLRFCLLTGALLDFFGAAVFVFPSVLFRLYGLDPSLLTTPARAGFLAAGALMLGWSGILVWAERNPVERKGVLIITVVPAIAGLAAAEIYVVAVGLVTAGRMVGTLTVQAVLSMTFLCAYAVSKRSHRFLKRRK